MAVYTIDASVWINAVERHEQDHHASRELLGQLRQRHVAIIVPTLSIVEVAGTIGRMYDEVRAQRLINLFLQLRGVSFIPLDTDLAHQAANLAGTYRLRGADAVYAAVAQQAGATLVSRDREHLTRLRDVLPVLHPTEALAVL